MTHHPTEMLANVVKSASSGFASGAKDPEGVAQVRMNNIETDGGWNWSTIRRVPPNVAKVRYHLSSGDVLFNATNSPSLVGKAAHFDSFNEPVVFSNHFIRLRPATDRLDGRYLARWLNLLWKMRVFETRCTQWVNQATYRKEDLLSLEVPLPPLAEQKRIAAILDTADALRAKRRESLAQLDALLQSVFLDMFGDPVRNPKGWKVGVIRDLLISANYGTSKKASSEKGAYPIIRMGNITYSGAWDFQDLKYIDIDKKDLSKHLVHKGQILFNRTNSKELVGKTAVYHREEPMAFAGYLVRGITNESADPEYIGTFMNTPQIKQFLQNKCKNIVGMANINAKEFQAIPIPIPPLFLQQRFATIVEAIEQQKARLRAHLAELDTLFASLQSRAFNGEL